MTALAQLVVSWPRWRVGLKCSTVANIVARTSKLLRKLNKCGILVNANRGEPVIHKSMAESINRQGAIEKEGEKNTLLLTARRLKRQQVCGRLKIILVKLHEKTGQKASSRRQLIIDFQNEMVEMQLSYVKV